MSTGPTTYKDTQGKSLCIVCSVCSGPASTSEVEYTHTIDTTLRTEGTALDSESRVIPPNRPLLAYCYEWSMFSRLMLGGVTRNRHAIPPAENLINCVEMTRKRWSICEQKQKRSPESATRRFQRARRRTAEVVVFVIIRPLYGDNVGLSLEQLKALTA